MADNLSPEDKDFLAECEEELKDRYTDKDEEFMKVFNTEPCSPPIIESWWVPLNYGRRNDRRNRHHPYERQGNRDRGYPDRNQDRNRWGNQDRRPYSDYNRGYDRDDRGYRNQRPRYY